MTAMDSPAGRRAGGPIAVRVERRLSVPRWAPALMTLGAIGVALAISGFILLAVGGDPIRSFQHILEAALRPDDPVHPHEHAHQDPGERALGQCLPAPR